MTHAYTCYSCNGTFECERTEEDKLAEYHENTERIIEKHPELIDQLCEPISLCHECYKVAMADAKARGLI